MSADTTLLERILWSQVERPLQGRVPGFQSESEGARAMRAVLLAKELTAEEDAILARWDPALEPGKELFDRLLETRVNRAVREGVRAEAQRLGLAELPPLPRVLVAREGPEAEGNGRALARDREALRSDPRNSLADLLSHGSVDVAALEPGAKLDQLVDLLVLANQAAAESLRATLGPAATVGREGDGAQVDLLLAAHSPSIQVFDIERELARLERILWDAIPAERRPERGGAWSFGHDLTGELLGGKYRIRGLKGRGAFKTVYEGEDEMLGARVAVAVLNPKGARSTRALQHFQDEARKLTTLDHENIVRWITFDRTPDGLHYFVMEYLDGEELEKLLRREGRLAPKRVAEILLQVLGALRRAHAKGKLGSLLHLDLKPENVFVLPPLAPGEPERVKVIDFGIGQHVGAEVRAAEHPELRSLYDLPAADLGRSIASLLLPEDEPDGPEEMDDARDPVRRRVQRARGGTLLYASPEQCKHLAGHKDIEPLDGRSDLYSLGVMAFRMLTGQFPFARITTAFEAIHNHLETPPRKVGSLGIRVPRALASFVDRCLVKERDRRWKDAGEAYEALERIVRPRLSPLKVGVPIALAAGLGLAALHFTRDPVVNALTLVDPAIESVSGRVVNELFAGPESPARRLVLESDVAWDPGAPPPALMDATSGEPLQGWVARWSAEVPRGIEIASLEGAQSAAAVIELVVGRKLRWRSSRLALNHLGPWRIERVAVPGHEAEKRLDPRQHRLELEVGGEHEGRAALESIEVFHAGTRLARTSAASAGTRGELELYPGPILDELYTGEAREVELRIVARDRAGQEEEARLALRLAGAAADFGPLSGFVAKVERNSPPLPFPGETQLLLPENALRIEATSPARARVFLEPSGLPALTAEIADPAVPLLVTLSGLGIAGTAELPGTVRIELDDEPWVDRVASSIRTRRLPFRFTPVAPAIEAQLVVAGRELELAEQGAEDEARADHVHPAHATRLVVRTPPGTNLWIEAACTRDGEPERALERMTRPNGPFELALELPVEGVYRLLVRKHLLLAGDERGPFIPPEHAYRIVVDRTAPAVELATEGGAAVPGMEEALYREDGARRIAATVREGSAVASLRWSLALPDGSRRDGELAPPGASPESRVELPSLLEHQVTEGRYELELVASDRAGNVGRDACAWQVARSGPSLVLLEPLVTDEGRRWVIGLERAWSLRVRAGDPNGVASVRARFLHGGGAGPELDLRPAMGDLWELEETRRPPVHPWWTGKEVALELVALDRAGMETRTSALGIVPELPRKSALVIAPRERAAAAPSSEGAGAMVEIVAGEDYVFGGRSGEGRRPWSVAIPRGALSSFFLDAHEVRRGEFLEFLRDAAGYADRRWWPAGSVPEPARAAELTAALASEPGRAVTGVAWAEAHAYAAWRGKRLPTLLEWEFAVRGPDYLGRSPDASRGLPADWPANLITGVREWTATPQRLADDDLDFASQCRRYPERLLPPDAPGSGRGDASCGAHWVVGAPVSGEAPSWSSRSLHGDADGEGIGFRCAFGREAAHRLLERGDYLIVE